MVSGVWGEFQGVEGEKRLLSFKSYMVIVRSGRRFFHCIFYSRRPYPLYQSVKHETVLRKPLCGVSKPLKIYFRHIFLNKLSFASLTVEVAFSKL